MLSRLREQWVRYDLLEQRALHTVQLLPGPLPHADDLTEVWVGDDQSHPTVAVNVQCVLDSNTATVGSFGPGLVHREFDCSGLFARFVFTFRHCAVPGCFSAYSGKNRC